MSSSKSGDEFEVQSSKPDDSRSPSSFAGGRGDVELETLNFELVVEGLRKSFRGPAGRAVEVLRGVSFAARAGETVALVGASGAGKSTLLHVLGGLEAADAGSARLGAFDITRARASRLAQFRRSEVGFVFQSHRLLGDLSAEENVALPLMVALYQNSRCASPETAFGLKTCTTSGPSARARR